MSTRIGGDWNYSTPESTKVFNGFGGGRFNLTAGLSRTDRKGKKITCETKGTDILGKYNLRVVTA